MSNGKKRAVQPLRGHPLFAPAVALWFAALFGLGTLAAGTSVIESLVLALRVDSLLPAAAPPLGMTARVLVAGGMTVLGAVIGFVLAWIAAAPVRKRRADQAARAEAAAPSAAFEPELPAFRARDLHPDAPIRAPMAAHEELGERVLVDPVPAEPAIAPLAHLVDFPGEPVAEAQPGTGMLADLVELPREEPEDIEPAFEAPQAIEAEILPAEVFAETHAAAPEPEPEVIPAPSVPAPLPAAAQRIADADLEDLSNIELVERLAIAMQRRAAADEAADGTSVPFPSREDRVVAPLAPVLRSLAEKRPEETEKALRDALATLQRMSGAA